MENTQVTQNNKRKAWDLESDLGLFNGMLAVLGHNNGEQMNFWDFRKFVKVMETRATTTVSSILTILPSDTLKYILSYLLGEENGDRVTIIPLVCKQFAKYYGELEVVRFRLFFEKIRTRLMASMMFSALELGVFHRLQFDMFYNDHVMRRDEGIPPTENLSSTIVFFSREGKIDVTLCPLSETVDEDLVQTWQLERFCELGHVRERPRMVRIGSGRGNSKLQEKMYHACEGEDFPSFMRALLTAKNWADNGDGLIDFYRSKPGSVFFGERDHPGLIGKSKKVLDSLPPHHPMVLLFGPLVQKRFAEFQAPLWMLCEDDSHPGDTNLWEIKDEVWCSPLFTRPETFAIIKEIIVKHWGKGKWW